MQTRQHHKRYLPYLQYLPYFTFFIDAIKANIEGISVHICNNTNKAIINAKRLEKFQLENGRILQTVETNPYTEVYKIIEEIQKN